jgi:signal transduction histidine kinase
MRSLFIKIFLWFWLANMLVVGVLVLTTIGTPFGPERDKMRAFAVCMTTLAGEKAVTTLEREGIDGLRRQSGHLMRDAGIRLFLYDDKGEEVLSEPAPPGARELALRAAATGRPEQGDLREGPPVMAQCVVGVDGKRYVALGQWGPGPPMQLFADPYVTLLRLAAVILMAGMVCYWLARYLTGPLRKLRASARQLATGDLTVRVGTAVGNRRDEMGDLGRDFDFMAERVESLVSAQRRLLSDMSHELRSPLARLNVALGLARQRTGPEVSGTLDRIEREAQRLNELIGQLLELTRLESSANAAAGSQIDLAALAHEIVADAEFEAQSCNRHVRLLRCDECTVTGMAELLRSAIENVVRNGICYTPEGTQVEVTLSCESFEGRHRAVVLVRDFGPGVPASAIKDIFRPFYRVGDDRGRQTGGAGLGLAIAQQAIRLHGGSISAVNAPDGGLLVELSLPATPGSGDPGSSSQSSASV